MGRSSSPTDYHHHESSTTTTTRSTSPLHFLNPAAVAHFAHNHHHCSHHHHHHQRASAAAAQADISRLLDPSYLPSSSSRAAHAPAAAVTAYVDPHGDLHDPDFRHFPVSAQVLNPHHHHNPHHHPLQKRRGTSPRRPHFDWEIDLDEQALEEEYEEEGSFSKHINAHFVSAPRYPTSATTISTRSWSSSGQSQTSRHREASFSTLTTTNTNTSTTNAKYSPTYYSPTGTASTLPTSYEDEDDAMSAESPFEEDVVVEKKRRRLSKGDSKKEKERKEEKERIRAALEEARREKEAEEEMREREREEREREREKEVRRSSVDFIDLTPSPRRISRTYGRSRRRSLDLYQDERDHTADDEDDEGEEADDAAHLHPTSLTSRALSGAHGGEYVPTCTQGLKRQWQALSLGLRFSLFRAQRRVMKRVASLTT